MAKTTSQLIMHLNYRRILIPLLLSFGLTLLTASAKPNIILILADDMGWGDAGFNNCTDIPTPALDSLAKNGVVFEQGYAAHPYCSPSRAGLLTGRYPYRFGHDNNIPYQDVQPDDGLPLSETLLPEVLKENGYTTACIGKWHLGDHEHFWPTERGFDYWYGFAGGGRSFWGRDPSVTEENDLIRRNGEPVPLDEQSYLTDDFTDEAIQFIEKNKDEPFFIFLSYNAPHLPLHATTEYLELTEHIENPQRIAYGAMVAGMDKGIGNVKKKLDELGLTEDTMIIFYSDNGGHHGGASNLPYRGYKGMLYEGGIREPFVIQWPSHLPKGEKYEAPIIAYDLFPTILEAAGVKDNHKLHLDGEDLVPYIKEKNGIPHKTLFWRYSGGKGYAVRHGDFKLVKEYRLPIALFYLKNDSFERHNIASKHPEKVAELQKLYNEWNKDMVSPAWEDPHIPNVVKTQGNKEKMIKRASAGETF